MTVDLLDPWLVKRSRELHAELSSTPSAAHSVIMERHARAAVAERPDFITSEVPEADMVSCLYSASLRADDPDYEKKWLAGFMEMWSHPRTPQPSTPAEANARILSWREHLVNIGAFTPKDAEKLLPALQFDKE